MVLHLVPNHVDGQARPAAANWRVKMPANARRPKPGIVTCVKCGKPYKTQWRRAGIRNEIHYVPACKCRD